MDFTPRELEVLRLLARGYSVSEIAGRLNLQLPTVTLVARKLAARLGATSIPELRQKAREIT